MTTAKGIVVSKEKAFKLLEKSGITQAKLSEITGIPTALICRILNARHNPKVNTLQVIANALGCSVDDFIRDDKKL